MTRQYLYTAQGSYGNLYWGGAFIIGRKDLNFDDIAGLVETVRKCMHIGASVPMRVHSLNFVQEMRVH